MSLVFYFAKKSMISGPFSKEEVMEMTGDELSSRFNWIWNSVDRVWKSLDPAPQHEPDLEPKTRSKGEESFCLLGGSVLKGVLINENDFGLELEIGNKNQMPVFQKGQFFSLCKVDNSLEGLIEKMVIADLSRCDDKWILKARFVGG